MTTPHDFSHGYHHDHLEVDLERVQKTRKIAKLPGLEVLTPMGAASLFGKSQEAVRKAVRLEHVYAPFDLWITDRAVRMIKLVSAMDYWGTGDDFDFDERLEQRKRTHL